MRLKNPVRKLLTQGDLDLENLSSYIEFSNYSNKAIFRTLTSIIYDPDQIIRQKACFALGKVATKIALGNLAFVSEQIRRFLWCLNDDSGNNPFGVPEALGEIGNNVPTLFVDTFPIILNYLSDKKLLPGVLQAAGRIGQKRPDWLESNLEKFRDLLKSQELLVAGNAALALNRIMQNSSAQNLTKIKEALKELADDDRQVNIFCKDRELEIAISNFAGQDLNFEAELVFILRT